MSFHSTNFKRPTFLEFVALCGDISTFLLFIFSASRRLINENEDLRRNNFLCQKRVLILHWGHQSYKQKTAGPGHWPLHPHQQKWRLHFNQALVGSGGGFIGWWVVSDTKDPTIFMVKLSTNWKYNSSTIFACAPCSKNWRLGMARFKKWTTAYESKIWLAELKFAKSRILGHREKELLLITSISRA